MPFKSLDSATGVVILGSAMKIAKADPRVRLLILGIAGGAAVFHLYTAGVAPLTALIQRPLHLALMGCLAFLGLTNMGSSDPSDDKRRVPPDRRRGRDTANHDG